MQERKDIWPDSFLMAILFFPYYVLRDQEFSIAFRVLLATVISAQYICFLIACFCRLMVFILN